MDRYSSISKWYIILPVSTTREDSITNMHQLHTMHIFKCTGNCPPSSNILWVFSEVTDESRDVTQFLYKLELRMTIDVMYLYYYMQSEFTIKLH